MTEIVNLRRARKARAKADKAAEANANRIKFGRTKSEKALSARQMTMDAHKLDGARIENAHEKPAQKR